jgi:bacterioferritin (cytochrome b1)
MNPVKTKTRHLEFVLLTEEQYSNLCALLGPDGAADWIEELNDYLGKSEKNLKKYDSHYHTIRSWARKQAKAKKQHQGPAADNSRAADRFIADLKECGSWPVMSAEIREIVYAVLRKRQQQWPALKKALLDDPTLADQLKAEFLSFAALVEVRRKA